MHSFSHWSHSLQHLADKQHTELQHNNSKVYANTNYLTWPCHHNQCTVHQKWTAKQDMCWAHHNWSAASQKDCQRQLWRVQHRGGYHWICLHDRQNAMQTTLTSKVQRLLFTGKLEVSNNMCAQRKPTIWLLTGYPSISLDIQQQLIT